MVHPPSGNDKNPESAREGTFTVEKAKSNLSVYTYWGYIGIMENDMETTIMGLGYEGL